jgi:glutamyl-tRNA reductase
MHITSVGINHQTAPVAVREKVAIGGNKLDEALAGLKNYLAQGVILSTCNRTEIYLVDDEEHAGEQAALGFLNDRLGRLAGDWRQYIYITRELAAIRHLVRIASGLESMVVGEFEVLGQVRQSLESAQKAGMVNLPLRHMFNTAIRTGRAVREHTSISKNPISVSSVAVDLATKAVADLVSAKLLVIGAGEAGRLVAKVAYERGVRQIIIGSRTKERAQETAAAFHGKAINLETLEEELAGTDIVVTCATAPHRLVGIEQIEKIMSRRPDAPMVIIDIAVPRNVAPEVGSIRNVFLYSIDDLTEISDANRHKREGSIQQAESIITAEMDKVAVWWQEHEVRPLIGALMGKAEGIRSAQLEKTLKNFAFLTDEQRENLESMTRSIVTRILQDPVQYLKAHGHNGHSEILKELFGIDPENAQ